MNYELKPCPWCGSKNVSLITEYGCRLLHTILCEDCEMAVNAKYVAPAWNALPRAPQWVAFSPEAIEPFRDKLVLIRTKRADGGQVIETARPRLFHYNEDVPIWDWSTAYSDWPCQDSDYFMELPTIQGDGPDLDCDPAICDGIGKDCDKKDGCGFLAALAKEDSNG